jgi:hypothetical protein
MTVHYSVTVDFDSSEEHTRSDIYDLFEAFIEQTFAHGVMTSCDTWMEDDGE